MNEQILLDIINTVRENKGNTPVSLIYPNTKLREDLGFDSLDLAELTARIESECGLDVFKSGIVQTVGEIESQVIKE